MEKPKARLIGINGNIFNLLGVASRSLKEVGLDDQSRKMNARVMAEAHSYDEALRIIMEYVEVE